jgi:hypothetical protein
MECLNFNGLIILFLFLNILTGCAKKENSLTLVSDPIATFFPEEILPDIASPCFDGSYYRKALSSEDVWLGITGTVILPTISFDPTRINPSNSAQFLDNPSVYMGGTANGQETDIGMTWEVIIDSNGNVTADKRAFRPFMRRAAYSFTNQAAIYENAPAEAAYYWYQGDTITMSVQVTSNGNIHFIVQGEGKKYECDFPADGYQLNSPMQFKRVNAIDQVSNEGDPVKPTKTKVTGSQWLSTYLYRNYNDSIVKAPMHQNRFTDMRCPDAKYFIISTTAAQDKVGGESIVIDGGK